jgi:proline dehydrogenase
VLYHLAKRFIAGESIEVALPKVQLLAANGFLTTLDCLGENIKDVSGTDAATSEYLLLLRALHEHGLDCNISVKLSQLGLAMKPQLARDHLMRIVGEAKRLGGFVEIDMEGSEHTSATLEIVAEVHRQIPAIGVAIQAMLRRSKIDIASLCAERVRVRLVKGAYKENRRAALQRSQEIQDQFILLMEQLLREGNCPAIATHDEYLIETTKTMAQRFGLKPDAFEFQMLYGVRPRLQESLRAEGWRTRIYVPYGNAWTHYLWRRLRERKENVWFVMKSMFND